MSTLILRSHSLPLLSPISSPCLVSRPNLTPNAGRPLPLLPWDILHLILLHSDPHTLALVSRVSYDLFLAASPMLYGGTVRVGSLSGLRSLFLERTRAPGGEETTWRLDSQLSLTQMKNLTIDLRSHTNHPNQWTSSLASLSFSRLLPSPTPSTLPSPSLSPPMILPLNHLQIILPPAAGSLLTTLHLTLLPHLNPVSLTLTSYPGTPSPSSWHYLATYSPLLESFTRLEEVVFEGVIPVRKGGGFFLAGLPRGVVSKVGRCVFELGEGERAKILSRWAERVSELGMGEMADGSVVLRVSSERERAETEMVVRGMAWEVARLLRIEIKTPKTASAAALLPNVTIRSPNSSSP